MLLHWYFLCFAAAGQVFPNFLVSFEVVGFVVLESGGNNAK